MIWPLILLWACLFGLALLVVAGGTRFADDEYRPLAEFQAENDGLGRCVRRVQQYDPARGWHPSHGPLTSRGVNPSADRRS